MKCYASPEDVCHNIILCEPLGKCYYEEELNKHPLNKPRIPEFIELLDASKAIHLKKNQDYANDNNPFSNFERSALLIEWFSNSVDKTFMGLIGTKLARIAELSDGRKVQNESLDDSFLDLVTYCALWASYVKRQRKNQIVICPKCNHQGLHHNNDGCTFCNCEIRGDELFPISIKK